MISSNGNGIAWFKNFTSALIIAALSAAVSISVERMQMGSQSEQARIALDSSINNKISLLEQRVLAIENILVTRAPYYERIITLENKAQTHIENTIELREHIDRDSQRLEQRLDEIEKLIRIPFDQRPGARRKVD